MPAGEFVKAGRHRAELLAAVHQPLHLIAAAGADPGQTSAAAHRSALAGPVGLLVIALGDRVADPAAGCRARRLHPRRAGASTPTRPRAVFDWRCGPCPLRKRCTRAKDGKPSTCIPRKPNWRRPAAAPPTQPSRPATGAGGQWWNARSPGAGRKRPPPGPLPRPGPQPTRPVSPGGRDQPAPADRHGAGPYRCRVGAGLTRCQRAQGVNEGRLYGLSVTPAAPRRRPLPAPATAPSSCRRAGLGTSTGYSARRAVAGWVRPAQPAGTRAPSTASATPAAPSPTSSAGP